jgi:peptidoglycan/LPS O-acetylase OafA/YrhL
MPNAPAQVVPGHRADIDGLRGLAIGAVVLFHVAPALLAGGFVGIDLFFVISGYLITGQLEQHLQRQTFSLRDFYVRRVRRLFPALLLMLSTVLVAGFDVMLPQEYVRLAKHTLGSLSFILNYILWGEGSYFDFSALTKPLHHLWSLAVEEQFYLLWPWVLWGLSRTNTRVKWGMLTFILGGSFLYSLWLVLDDTVAAYFLPFGRLWQLGLGGVVAMLPRLKVRGVGSVVFCALLLSSFALSRSGGYPGVYALVPSLGAAGVIASDPNSGPNRWLFGLKPLRALGLISYPLYLWHWPVLVFVTLVHPELSEVTSALVTVLISVALATATWWWVETPIRVDRKVSVRTLMAAGAAIFTVTGVAYAGIIPTRSSGLRISAFERATTGWSFPTPSLQPFVFQGETFQAHGPAPAAVLLVGDSNMEQYAAALETRLKLGPVRSFAFVTHGGCAPFVVFDNAPGCPKFFAAMRELVETSSADTVIIASNWALYFDNARFLLGGHELSFGDPRAVRIRLEFSQWLKKLAQSKRVVVVLNIPVAPEMGPLRVAQRSWLGGAQLDTRPLRRATMAATLAPVTQWLRETAAEAGAEVIDPFDSLCDAEWCPVAGPDGLPIYRDPHHIRPGHLENRFHAFDAFLGEPRPGGPEDTRR